MHGVVGLNLEAQMYYTLTRFFANSICLYGPRQNLCSIPSVYRNSWLHSFYNLFPLEMHKLLFFSILCECMFFFVLFFLHKWSIICSRALRDSISHFRYPLCNHVRDFVSFRLLNLPHSRSFLVFLSLLFHTLFPRLLSPYSLVLLLRAGFFSVSFSSLCVF